jgi:hypothetical protein
MNQLTSTSRARSWEIACALASTLTPCRPCGRLADERQRFDERSQSAQRDSDRRRQCGHPQTGPELQDVGQRLGDASGHRRLRLCPQLGRRPTQAQCPNRTGRLVAQGFGIHGLADSVSRTTLVLADGVLVGAQQPQSFGAKHGGSDLLGLNPETGDLLWKVMLDKHPRRS